MINHPSQSLSNALPFRRIRGRSAASLLALLLSLGSAEVSKAVTPGTPSIVVHGGATTAAAVLTPAYAWSTMTTTNAPAARANIYYQCVWTGNTGNASTANRMIVWGGDNGTTSLTSGGIYNPATDTWTAMSTTNAPVGTSGASAVWTGATGSPATANKMIIVGGTLIQSTTTVNTGGMYDPATDTWTSISTSGALALETRPPVWTGNTGNAATSYRMILFGGDNAGSQSSTNATSIYDPLTNSWTAGSTTSAPSGRYLHSAVWTGNTGNAATANLMIVYGGEDFASSVVTNTGGIYNPLTNAWTTLPASATLGLRENHSAVWTGSAMVIWGGDTNASSPSYPTAGASYNPATSTWTDISTTGVPAGRQNGSSFWTGDGMVVWSGALYTGSSWTLKGDGGLYNAQGNSWPSLPTAGAPSARFLNGATWTGSQLILFGGFTNSALTTTTNTGGVLTNEPAVNLGSQPTGTPFAQSFNIDNALGTDALTGATVTFSGTNASDFAVGTAPAASIAAGGNGAFSINFTPGAAGARSAIMAITSNDPNRSPYLVALSGTGIASLSNNANLSALSLSAGSITFAAATTSYSFSVTNATASTTVTATRADANATLQVQVNGGGFNALTSGTASGPLTLNVGSNTVDVKVTAQDGTTIKTYTTTITRAAAPGFTNLYSFTTNDGTNPYDGVRQFADGTLYGACYAGGNQGTGGYGGTIFKMQPDGTGITSIHKFNGINSGGSPNVGGYQPQTSPVPAADGYLYGITHYGGTTGYGTFFRVMPDGSNFSVQHDFVSSVNDPSGTNWGVVQGTDSFFYGFGFGGGGVNSVVFKINAAGSTIQKIATFATGSGSVGSPFLVAADGMLYGLSYTDGSGGGTVFRLNNDGTGYQILHTFTAGEGQSPYSGLIQAGDGTLYGSTMNGSGVAKIFKMSTDGATFNVIHSLTTAEGLYTYGRLLLASDGKLYGTGYGGGANSKGTLFSLNTDGSSFTVLHDFAGTTDHAFPNGSLIQGIDSRIYGSTADVDLGNAFIGTGSVFAYGASVAPSGPTVTSATASLAANASQLIINGTGFSTTAANNTVTFTPAGTGTVTAATATQLTVTSLSGLVAGALNAVVTTNSVGSGAAVQVATVTPVVTSSLANLASNATTLTINGFGFSTTAASNTVAFTPAGTTGTVTSATNTSLTVTSLSGLVTGSLSAVVTTNGQNSGAAVQVATVQPPPVAISSLTAVTSSPTNAASVSWTLTFASAVTGLTSSNLGLAGAAASGSSISSVSTSNGGLTYSIAVTTGSTDGALTLQVANATGLSKSISNTLPYNGDTINIDKTPPTVVSVTRLTPSAQTTNASSVTFRVTYSEPVTLNAPATSRFQVVPVNGGTVVASVTGVTGTGATRDVTVTITGGAGEFRLRVRD